MHVDDTLQFTVSEINAQVRTLIEEAYPLVRVVGEVSNFKRHTSGHLYFTLKDARSQLRAAVFRSDARRLRFDPEDGLKVIASGRLTMYEPYGQYQLVASAIEPAGAGELELAFQALKERLEAEGLFDEERKQPLPRYPLRVAVITSPTGAAVRDIRSTLARRWPCAEVLLIPVRVQGEFAAPEIARGLDWASDYPDVDVVIVGRGGGSLEDLWAFNEEAVARAIARCRVPVISAVGHETDFSIADYVADRRAATPTMAGEIAVPEITAVLENIDGLCGYLQREVTSRIESSRAHLREMLRSYALGSVVGRIQSAMQGHDLLMEKLLNRVGERCARDAARLNQVSSRLEALDPRAVLSRGYAICSDESGRRIVADADTAVDTERLRVTFRDGGVRVAVEERIDARKES